jgi:hypothetical protein
MGSLVILAVFGVMGAFDRSDRALERRFTQTTELARVQTVMRRTFAKVVLTNDKTPLNLPDEPAPRNPIPGSDRQQAPTSFPGPRLLLTPDPTLRGISMIPRKAANDPSIRATPVQRFEIVTERAPINDGGARRASSGSSSTPAEPAAAGVDAPLPPAKPAADDELPPADSDAQNDPDADLDADPGEATMGFVRGVFELRPTLRRLSRLREMGYTINPNELERQADRPTWDLYWTRLGPRAARERPDVVDQPAEPTGTPVLLASNITYFYIRLFEDRRWQDSMDATFFPQLPAYAEVNIEMASGIWASWTFELGWMLGPEVPVSSSKPAGQGDDDDDDAGTPGSSNPAGGAPATGTPRAIPLTPVIPSSRGNSAGKPQR